MEKFVPFVDAKQKIAEAGADHRVVELDAEARTIVGGQKLSIDHVEAHDAQRHLDGIVRRDPRIDEGRKNDIVTNQSRGDGPIDLSKKRKSDSAEAPIDLDDIDCEGMLVDQNCDQVRRKIRRFLDSGAMKVGEFCNAIGVSNKSLNDFLRQSGAMKGSGSATYDGAWEFFKKREIVGLKMPNKKQKTSTSDNATSSATNGAARKTGNDAPVDISSIYLHQEEFDDVPVYDTCDEVRRKINNHLKKSNVTQAQFCRDLSAQLHSGQSIQSAQLGSFRNKKGANAGNMSSVYYAAYVFCEKLRIKEGKAKSMHRLDMEDIWPGGTDREHNLTNRK